MTAATGPSGGTSILDELRSPSLGPSLLQSLLHRLLSHPRVHNGFVDVLKFSSVQAALAKMDARNRDALVNTVKLFAFGTIGEYRDAKERDEGSVWTLNDAQLEKLRMLSVVSVARSHIDASNPPGDVEMADGGGRPRRRPGGRGRKNGKKGGEGALCVPYSRLASELRIPEGGTYDGTIHVRQLEDLLIQCIYSNVVAARLDQAGGCLRIEPQAALAREGGSSAGGAGVHGSVLSRDLDTTTPESTKAEASRMIAELGRFLARSDAVLATLENSSKAARSERTEDELRWRSVQKAVDEGPHKLRDGAGGGAMGAGGGEPMEVVAAGGRRQVKRSREGSAMARGGGAGVRFT